jgi:hypothetical protein
MEGGYSGFYYPKYDIERNGEYITINPYNLYSLETSQYLSSRIKDGFIVCEIGAGDGHVCRDIVGLGKNIKYIILDLPELCFRSSIFLKNFFPEKVVKVFNDFQGGPLGMRDLLQQCDILVLPCWYAEQIIADRIDIDLYINTHSFGEMPVSVARKYCSIINASGRSLLSINREFGFEWKLKRTSGRHLTESSLHSYTGELSSMKLIDSDYPVSSNPFFKRPTYVRSLYVKG